MLCLLSRGIYCNDDQLCHCITLLIYPPRHCNNDECFDAATINGLHIVKLLCTYIPAPEIVELKYTTYTKLVNDFDTGLNGAAVSYYSPSVMRLALTKLHSISIVLQYRETIAYYNSDIYELTVQLYVSAQELGYMLALCSNKLHELLSWDSFENELLDLNNRTLEYKDDFLSEATSSLLIVAPTFNTEEVWIKRSMWHNHDDYKSDIGAARPLALAFRTYKLNNKLSVIT
jgi:hypothetical protein